MTDDAGWEFYRTFLGVLREGSLSGAARALGITQPTVGRHVDALERTLGLTLFTRSPSGLLPTDAARALRGYAEAMHSHAAALRRAAEGEGAGPKGTVRIAASEVIGIEVLPALIAALREDHPALTIELVLSDRLQDLLRREADVAVRMTPPQQGQLVARKVGEVPLGLHAHRAYLERHGTPASLAELTSGHALIGFDEETPFIRAARKAWPAWRREAFALRTGSDIGQLALLRAGCGIGICQVALARRDAALVRLLPREFEIGLPTWIVMHEDQRHSARCKLVFDALVQGLTAHVAAGRPARGPRRAAAQR